jgi:hypothetical protein
MDMKQSSFSVQDSRSETVDQSYVFKKRWMAPLLEGLQALNWISFFGILSREDGALGDKRTLEWSDIAMGGRIWTLS